MAIVANIPTESNKIIRNKGSIYQHNAIIRVSEYNRSRLMISKVLINRLGVNINTEGVRFETIRGHLVISKGLLKDGFIRVSIENKYTYRLINRSQHSTILQSFNKDGNHPFFIEMRFDKTFFIKRAKRYNGKQYSKTSSFAPQ